MKTPISSELGDAFAEHLSEKHMHIHRGALWVSLQGTPYLCMFGNDNYNAPKTKAYVGALSDCPWMREWMVAAKREKYMKPMRVFGLSNSPTPTWVIACDLIPPGKKFPAKMGERLRKKVSELVWLEWTRCEVDEPEAMC